MVRISAEEYEAGGLHPEDMKSTVQVIEEAGAAAISVSSGGLNTGAVHAYPLYQIPYAEKIRTMTTLPVMGVGCITKRIGNRVRSCRRSAVIMCFSGGNYCVIRFFC
ncbi:MAG: hypothetical protein ACLTDX_23090 [[Clostridium] innocuum]